MEPETKRILSLLNTIFEKNAWHGPAVKEVLNQIQEKEAFRRLAQTHSIIELVAHMTAWRRYVTEKLKCNPGYPVTEEMNFPHPQNWKETVRELETSQHELMKALEDFPEEKLHTQVPGKTNPLTFYTLLHGAIQHDLYHTAQIMLITKATATQSF